MDELLRRAAAQDLARSVLLDAVASVAAVLALTFWRSGALGLTLGRDAPSLEMYVPEQVAPPAAGSIPEVGFDQPPRPGERGAGALTRRAYEARH